MNIGLLLYKNVIGGVETTSLALAHLLHKQQHDVFFIYPGLERDADIKKLEIPDIFKVYTIRHSDTRITVKDMTLFIADVMNYEAPDIVISMFLEESYILLKAQKHIHRMFKLIMMNHGGYCHTYSSFWKERQITIYNQATALVTVTQLDEDYYKTLLDVPVVTIKNLPLATFYTDIIPLEYREGSKKILTLGRLVKNKGFDILIRAFSTLPPQDWTLHIYGDGPEKESLEHLITTTKMEKTIYIYPATKDVPAAMNNHDMFVFPSLVESYGMVLLEALLMGLPSISFDCPNGPALIESELPGCVILVPEKDEARLAHEINILMNNADKRLRLSHLARQYRRIVNQENNAALWQNVFAMKK